VYFCEEFVSPRAQEVLPVGDVPYGVARGLQVFWKKQRRSGGFEEWNSLKPPARK